MKSYYQLVRHDGNQELFRTVEMSVIAIANGHPFHIHAEGLRGTGKTTIMRAVKDILPPIVRIKNCIYNCHPANPHCPEHRSLLPEQIAAIGTEVVPCPFLEISHSAKIGTVVGSIDLNKLTDRIHPTAALLPGTIPQAHRGIIFIDEINRLADTSPELADVLLDVMGTKPGRIQIEETGLPKIELPVNVTIWAASNPDEDPGPLVQVRKQLSDRFDLSVNMGRPSAYRDIMAILENRNHHGRSTSDQMSIPGNIHAVTADEEIKKALANIYVDYGIESIRAVEGMETAAGLTALLDGRSRTSIRDLIKVVPLVLGHRADKTTITSILRYLDNFTNCNSVPGNVSAGVNATGESIIENIEKKPPVWSELKKLMLHWFQRLRLKKNSRGQDNPKPAQNTNTQANAGKASGNHSQTGNNSHTGTGQQAQKSAAAESNQSEAKPTGQTGKRMQTKGEGSSDALNSPIIAPPQCAMPLINHSLDKFVSSEEKN
ncbi:magnesium chelatase [bacterium BFN5]|nr:magnesium chelatase [bacterium BFN5]